MQGKRSYFWVLVLLVSLLAYAKNGFSQEGAVGLEPEVKKNKAAVVFSSKYPNLSLKKAYNLQKAYVKNKVSKGIKIVGYKAGLTSKGAAQKYALSEPISGVLIEEPLSGDGLVLNLKETNKLMIEQEIAFRFSGATKENMTLDQLQQSVDAVAPVIELPDISFPDNQYKGLDIIANNALGYKLILGEWQGVPKDIDNINVSLSCSASVVSEGVSSNVIGGQWQMLLWLVNHLAEHGYRVQPGQIVLTGNIGKMIEARPCDYKANFGQLGKMTFRIDA